ncbi:hypothetical protein HMPREF9120_01089 [Neisseria sp. oral taxon 020 str. F0370]|nr:hypothetical protein HMPREF9120_01089 [Neisseria sp. oral taxon 020 str. F0370]
MRGFVFHAGISMTHTSKKSAFIATGLMLFALFFGAGNLIYPPVLGQNAGRRCGPRWPDSCLRASACRWRGCWRWPIPARAICGFGRARGQGLRRVFRRRPLSGHQPSVCRAAYGDGVV